MSIENPYESPAPQQAVDTSPPKFRILAVIVGVATDIGLSLAIGIVLGVIAVGSSCPRGWDWTILSRKLLA